MKRPFTHGGQLRSWPDPGDAVKIPVPSPLESDEPLGDDAWPEEGVPDAEGGGLDDAGEGSPSDADAEPVDESGWLDAGDEADDADVGDLADEILEDDASWRDDEDFVPTDDDESGVADDAEGLLGGDDAEGPDEAHEGADETETLRRGDDVDDEGIEPAGDDMGEATVPPAFRLPRPARATIALRGGAFPVHAAVALEGRLILAGTSTAVVDATREGAQAARRAGALVLDDEDVAISAVRLGGSGVVLSTLRGRTFASDDAGGHWREVVADAPREPRELFAAEAGVYGRSATGGLSWVGPELRRWESVEIEHVETVVCDGAVAFAAAEDGTLWRARTPTRFERVASRVPAGVLALHVGGEAWVAQVRDGSVRVAPRLGEPWISWPTFQGATALAVIATDDGMIQVLAAVPDASHRVATLLQAGIAADGQPVLTRRIVDIEGPTSGRDDDDEALLDAITSFPGVPRRLALVGSAGVATLSLEGDAPL